MPKKDTQFKKGVSGNPGGRRAVHPDVKKFQELSYKEFIDALQKYGSMTRESLAADLKRPDATMFQLMFGHIVAQAAKGDHQARNLLIDRLWGRLTDQSSIRITQAGVTMHSEIEIKGPWDLKETE